MTDWTEDQDAFLIAMWEEGLSHVEIASVLDRTKRAVGMRITRLNKGYKVTRVRIKVDES